MKRLFLGMVSLTGLVLLFFLSFNSGLDDEKYFIEPSPKWWESYDLSDIPVQTGELHLYRFHQLFNNQLSEALPNDSTIFKYMEEEVSNFPARFASKNRNPVICSEFPGIFSVQFVNTHWQVFQHTNGTFNLLNAFYDNRAALKTPCIRILGTANILESTIKSCKILCQLWFENMNRPLIYPVTEFRYLWVRYWGQQSPKYQHPYLWACPIPDSHRNEVPVAVSLVENKCDTATNVLKVVNNRPKNGVKKKFGVCVKQLDFLYSDMSVLLLEWLELLFSMGVEKVHMYDLAVHENIIKVLKYYQNRGKVELSPITLPGHQPNIPSFYHPYFHKSSWSKHFLEDMLFNDCFYRNMYNFEWLVVLDVDELIMPVGNMKTWSEILDNVNNTFEGYGFRNIYYFDNNKFFNITHEKIAPYLHFSNWVHRTANYSKKFHYSKSFFSTEQVVTIHNHYALSCAHREHCKWHEVSTDIARLQHYCFNKHQVKACMENPKSSVIDPNIWKYHNAIVNRSLTTLEDLDFINRYEINKL